MAEPITEGYQKCGGECGETKHITEFGVDRSKKHGRKYVCIDCINRRQRKTEDGYKRYGMATVREFDGFMNCTHPDHEGEVWLEPACFARDKSKKRGRRGHCKDCVRRRDGWKTARDPVVTNDDGTARECCRCGWMLDFNLFFNVSPNNKLGHESYCRGCRNGLTHEELEAKMLYDCLWELHQEQALLEGKLFCRGCKIKWPQEDFKTNENSPFSFIEYCWGCTSNKSSEGVEWERKQREAIKHDMKWCFDCGECHPLSAYYPSPIGKFGVMHVCIDCYKIRQVKIRQLKPEYRVRINDQNRKRYAEDDLYRLITNVRGAVKQSLIKGGWKKDSPTYEYLQISYKEFMTYINSGTFTFGDPNIELELDHTIPISKARTHDEVRALSHWANWRLVEKDVNRRKSDNLPIRELLNESLPPLALAIYEREVEENGPGTWTE